MFKSMDIKDCMILHPVSVRADTNLFEAIRLILANKVSGVVVIDEHGRPSGMLSEMDCLRAILKGVYYQEADGLVGEHMSAPCETVSPQDDIIALAQSMLKSKRRRRPVVDGDDVLIGQVTCRQILRVVSAWNMPSRSR